MMTDRNAQLLQETCPKATMDTVITDSQLKQTGRNKIHGIIRSQAMPMSAKASSQATLTYTTSITKRKGLRDWKNSLDRYHQMQATPILVQGIGSPHRIHGVSSRRTCTATCTAIAHLDQKDGVRSLTASSPPVKQVHLEITISGIERGRFNLV